MYFRLEFNIDPLANLEMIALRNHEYIYIVDPLFDRKLIRILYLRKTFNPQIELNEVFQMSVLRASFIQKSYLL